MNEVTSTEELLLEVFWRLPFHSLATAKQVCKKWKQITESDAFRRSYRDTAKLVEKRQHFGLTTYEIIDSNNHVRSVGCRGLVFGGLTSHHSSLMPGYSFQTDKYYICNVFSNRREKIPRPCKNFVLSFFGIFALEPGGQDRRIIFWGYHGEVMVLVRDGEQQQLQWSMLRAPVAYRNWGTTVVLGISMFRVDLIEKKLVELNVLADDGYSLSIPITKSDQSCDEILTIGESYHELVVWNDGMYLVSKPRGSKMFRIWRISTSDGRATFVDKFEEEMPEMISVECLGVEDEHIYIHGPSAFPEEYQISILYNMRSNCIGKTINSSSYDVPRTLPVILCDWH